MALPAEHAGLNLDQLLAHAQEAVDTAATILTTTEPGKLTAKGDRDYATELDYRIEETVKQQLSEATPDIGFLGEEHGPDTITEPVSWVLDPIDGTVNFAHGLPLCGISLALVAGDRPILGVIDLPFLSARYTGTEGGGAHRNGHEIQASTTAQLSDAVIAMGDYAVGEGAATKNDQRLELTRLLAQNALRVRMVGSAAIDLAWVAHGAIDACVSLSNKAWDVAAGVVIAREAGADVIDLDGSRHTPNSTATIAVGNQLQAPLRDLLRQVGSA